MRATREILNKAKVDGEEAVVSSGPLKCPRCSGEVPRMHRYCGFCGHNLSGSLPAQAVGDPLVGAVVGGRYRLLGKIGSGGMGTVYKVEHVQMGKIMAMKLLHGDLSRDESMIRRFNREGRAVSRLASMHTVQVFDYGQSDGLVYLVMEYLRGRDLGHLVTEMGSLSVERCAEITFQVCKALTEAHDKGVIHRDLKPENIFLCAPQGGQELVKVLDFGLAKLLEREELGAQTLGGSLIGTPYYMSPEQISGSDVGPRSDVYGLGALMFKLATGEPPFKSKHPMGVLTAHLHDPIPRAAELDPDRADELGRLDPIFQRAMAKDPEARFESVAALARELKAQMARDLASEIKKREGASLVEPWFEPDALTEPEHAISTRKDWARFERGLRLRRAASVAVFVFLLAAAGYGTWWGVVEGNFFKRDVESEPNDRTLDATMVNLGQPMRGNIGLAASGARADQDFFEIRGDITPGHVIDVKVTGIEGLDMVVEAFGMGGQRLAVANGGLVGQGEVLRGVLWSGSPIFVLVREVWTEGIPARSAPESSYTLVASSSARTLGTEREPNGLVKHAEPIRPGEQRYGDISERSDVDLYVLPPLSPTGHMLTALLTSPPEQDLALELVDGGGTRLQVLNRKGAGEVERMELFVAPMGPQPLHLGVRAPDKGAAFKGATEQYKLEFKLTNLGESFKVPAKGGPP